MNPTIATILGTAAFGILKGKIGSSAKVIKCDEIKLGMTIRLRASSPKLNHINSGWSDSKFINKMNIIGVSIKCDGYYENHEIPDYLREEYGQEFTAYFGVYVMLKGRLEDLVVELTRDNKAYQLILDTIKELCVKNIFSLDSNAEIEIQTDNEFRNYSSIDQFINDYNYISDINFYDSRTTVNNSFYLADKKGDPIDPKDMTNQFPSTLLRKR